MKDQEKAAWRPRRFDVAGAHPDEVYRAVAEVAAAVDEVGKQFQRFTGMYRDVQTWRQNKPLRFGRNLDADVQQFLAQGVRIMDDFDEEMPLGLSDSHRQVRNRCNELARGMEKVLAKRPDERVPFDPWRAVKISVEAPPAKNGGTLLSIETRDRYRLALRGCFPRGPAQADRARTQYRIWEQNGERFQKDGPMNEAAQSWKRFMGVIDNMRSREQAKGVVWGRVDDVNGIDFRPALTQRPTFNSKPRMRM